MLSGVGPGEELRKFDISVLKESRVGYNLQDHVVFGSYWLFNESAVTVET